MPGNLREENARRQLELMNQSSARMRPILEQERELKQQIENERKAAEKRNRIENQQKDVQLLKKMYDVLSGVKNAQELLCNGISRADIAATLELAGNLMYATVPTAIGLAGKAVGKLVAGDPGSEAAESIKNAHEVVDAVAGAVGLAGNVPNAPSLLSTVPNLAGASNNSLVQQGMSWWMPGNPATVSLAVDSANAILTVLAHINTVTAITATQLTLDPLLALEQRYHGACSCCRLAEKVSYALMDKAGSAAAGLNPIAGAGAALYGVYDKTKHRYQKRQAKKNKKEVHREAYYIAQELWSAAQATTPAHRTFQYRFPEIPANDGRCPLALLILATLFGAGNPTEGAANAVAAIASDESSAVQQIRGLFE